MIHNHQQKTRFRSLTDDLCCIVVKEIKILFNLSYFIALIFIICYMCIRLPFQKVLKNLNYIECALVLEPAVVEELCTERANARANSLGDRSL